MWVRGEKYLGFLKLYTAEPGVLGWHSEVPTVCISITKSSYVKKNHFQPWKGIVY